MNSPSYDLLLSQLIELDNFDAIVEKCVRKGIPINSENVEFISELMQHKDYALDFIESFLAKKTLVEATGLTLTPSEEKSFYHAGANSQRLARGLEILVANEIAQIEEWREPLFKNPSAAPDIATALIYLIIKQNIRVGYLYQERLAESPVPMAEAFQIAREERSQLRQAQELLSPVGSYTSLRRLLQRYATENLGERPDKELLLKKVAALADFYERQPAQRSWMESVAGTYTEACVNQPAYGMMLLEAGRQLAHAITLDEQQKAASFLYVLHQARAVIEQEPSIVPSLKAEATNLLVRQTYERMKESFGDFFVFEKNIVNIHYLPEAQKEQVELRSRTIAKQTELLSKESLKEFLLSDSALESRQVWAGALLPKMTSAIKHEFEQRAQILIDCYEALDAGTSLSELQRTIAPTRAPLLEEAAKQPSAEAQKEFLYTQYTLNSIAQETALYHTVAQETAHILTPSIIATGRSLFERNLPSSNGKLRLGQKSR